MKKIVVSVLLQILYVLLDHTVSTKEKQTTHLVDAIQLNRLAIHNAISFSYRMQFVAVVQFAHSNKAHEENDNDGWARSCRSSNSILLYCTATAAAVSVFVNVVSTERCI